MELTLERAQLRCGRMGGGGDPPVDTEEEEADDVSDVTLPRAAAVPSVLVSKCSSGEGVLLRYIINTRSNEPLLDYNTFKFYFVW